MDSYVVPNYCQVWNEWLDIYLYSEVVITVVTNMFISEALKSSEIHAELIFYQYVVTVSNSFDSDAST